MRQSDDDAIYEEWLARLGRPRHVYVCDCSRRELGPGPYEGRCRARRLGPGRARGTRVVLEPGVERFDDALLGAQEQDPWRQCGDLLVRDRNGNWTYQFAVTVDDFRQEIDLVIRGSDLLDSTGRQLALARMLGRRSPPVFAHHPLVVKASGEKLSKAGRDTGLRDLRAAGWTAARVLGEAAFLGGLLPLAHPLQAAELPGLFLAEESA